MTSRILALLCLLVLVGCSDDTMEKTNIQVVTDAGDAGDPTDTGTAPNDSGAPDMTNRPDMAVEDTGLPDSGMADASGPDGGEPDMGGPFEWPATPQAFTTTATRVSYIDTFTVPVLSNEVPVCCRDFGAISDNPGQVDNALADLQAQLGGASGGAIDIEAGYAAALADGALVILLDHRELDGATDPDGFLLSWLTGRFAGSTTYADAGAGLGTFTLDAANFIAGTGEPVRNVDRAVMNDGAMEGGPLSLEFFVPWASAFIPVMMEDVRLVADADIQPGSVAYSSGELSGYISREQVFEGMNTIAASADCACLGLNGADLYTQTGSGQWSGACVNQASSVCSEFDEDKCRIIAGSDIGAGETCSLFPTLIEVLADIDTDGDGEFDALSVGLNWSAVDATFE